VRWQCRTVLSVRISQSSCAERETYLSNKDQDDDEETEPRSVDTTSSLEWDLVDGVAVVSPSLAETDVGKADGAPSEEGSKTGQSDEPVKDRLTSRSKVHVAKHTPAKNKEDREKRATRAIDVGEHLGSVALVGKSRQSTGTSVDTRHTDRDNGDENDNVHEAVKSLETTITRGNDEWRSISTFGTEKILVVGADKKTDEGKTKNVEKSDSPEDLSDGTWKRFEGVLGLGSSQTNKLSTGESKGSGDEDRAEALEAVSEGTGVIPETGSPVLVVDAVVGTSTKHKDQGDDHEDDCRRELQARGPELFFSVTQGTENVDDDDEKPEYGDPDA
jgi:hypothetical protein